MEVKLMKKDDGITYISNIKAWNMAVPVSAPLKGLRFIGSFKRSQGHHVKTNTPSGHTLQLVIDGGLEFSLGNEKYSAKKGDVIYLYSSEIEDVQADADNGFEIITVNFDAPGLLPLPIHVFKSNREIRNCFAKTLAAYSENSETAVWNAYYCLYGLIYSIVRHKALSAVELMHKGEIWKSVENYVRRRRAFRITLKELGNIFRCSPANMAKSCLRTTGTNPKQRLKSILMAESRSLLMCSQTSVTETALLVGYQRVHEFSRDFSNFFGVPPSSLKLTLNAGNENKNQRNPQILSAEVLPHEVIC